MRFLSSVAGSCLLVAFNMQPSSCFTVHSHKSHRSAQTVLSLSKGFGSTNSGDSMPAQSKRTMGGEFELQEMKFQIPAMRKAGVTAQNLNEEKKAELSGYIREVVTRIPSPVPLKALADKDMLVGKWRLAFSTASTMADLPKEADVLIDIQEGNRLEYKLEFSKKVLGLNEITAESTYFVDSSPVNPGLVTYVYQNINAGVFGLTVPTGLFGMLKGRESYIESVWFDGRFWIDRKYSPEGEEYFSVYLKEEDDNVSGSDDVIEKSRY